jgi:hypothetical protein
MHRYMKVMGLQGKLVADPFRPGGHTPHFLGQRERVPAPTSTIDGELHLADYYEPYEVVVRVDAAGRKHVLDAKAAGDLVVLGECVAANAEKAAAEMAAKPTAKSGKGDK